MESLPRLGSGIRKNSGIFSLSCHRDYVDVTGARGTLEWEMLIYFKLAAALIPPWVGGGVVYYLIGASRDRRLQPMRWLRFIRSINSSYQKEGRVKEARDWRTAASSLPPPLLYINIEFFGGRRGAVVCGCAPGGHSSDRTVIAALGELGQYTRPHALTHTHSHSGGIFPSINSAEAPQELFSHRQ